MESIKTSEIQASQPAGFRDLSKVNSPFMKQWIWVGNTDSKLEMGARGVWSALKTFAYGLVNVVALSFLRSNESFFKKELPELKMAVGLPGSDLNRGQFGRIFSASNEAFRSDKTRIKNLDRVLTNTEESLSNSAHKTSIAKGKEDRYFHAEGCKFVYENSGASTDELIMAKQRLVETIETEVKSTDKYTMQKGNSASSIARRDYMLQGIMKFAQQNGLVEQFVLAAIKERSESQNPATANKEFIRSLQEAIAEELISVEDPRLSFALEQVTRAAMHKEQNKTVGLFGKTNPDGVVHDLARSFKAAGLLPHQDISQFVYNVKNGPVLEDEMQLSLEEGVVSRHGVNSSGKGSVSAPRNQTNNVESEMELEPETELELEQESSDAVSKKASSEKKAAKAAVETKESVELEPVDISSYVNTLKQLTEAQKKLVDDLGVLKTLLKMKAGDDLRELSKEQLLAMVETSRSLGLPVSVDKTKPADLEKNIVAVQAAIEQQKAVVNELMVIWKARPTDYRQAFKEQKSEVSNLDKEIRVNRAHIEEAQKGVARWEAVAQKAEVQTNSIISKGIPLVVGNPDEDVLDTAEISSEPKVEKPGFFSRLFSKETAAPKVAPQADEIELAEFDADEFDLSEPELV